MAGSNVTFNAAAFRTAIKNTMVMGSPTAVEDRATFRWKPVREFQVEDRNHKPYNWSAPPTSEDLHEDVQVDVAVDFGGGGNDDQTSFGDFDQTRAILTLLDVDYAQVVGANQVLLGENKYDIEYWAPPMALFEVGVYQAYCRAVDES